MRRGRPTRPTTTSQHSSAKPSPSPFRGPSSTDPFAVLDSGHKSRNSTDEFTNRFPSLDHFNILHEKGGKFDFEPSAAEAQQEDEDLARRLTNALADDAFVKRPSSENEPAPEPPVHRRPQPPPLKTRSVEPPKEEPIRPQVPLYQPVPQKPTMVSTGTMTSPPSTPSLSESKPSSRPIYKFSSDHQRRPSSQPWSADSEQRPQRPSKALSPTKSSSNLAANPRVSADRISDLSTSSSRPSLEGLRPTNLEVDDPVGRSKSANGKSRPVSMHAGTKFESARGSESARSSLDLPRPSYDMGVPLQHARTEVEPNLDRANISSDIDYLRAREEESNRKREKRYSGSSKHTKRSSLSTLSLSGTKNRFAGRFGEAFRRFEQTNSDSKPQSPAAEENPKQFPAVIASEMVEPPAEISDDEDDISPEMRRELERRRLSQEEKRVASAAAEYRRQVAEGGGRGETPRSLAIQGRVKNLLAEGNKPAPPPKTATGYGRYTDDSPGALQAKQAEARPEPRLNTRNVAPAAYGSPQTQSSPGADRWDSPSTLPRQETARTGSARPAAPPKPKNLRAMGPEAVSGGDDRSPIQEAPTTPGEDWEANFSRRYPSLSGLEMVETEIEAPKFPSLRTREV